MKLTRKAVMNFIGLLDLEYNRQSRLSPEDKKVKAELWYNALSMYKYEEVEKAVYSLVTTSEFMPRLSEIVKCCYQNRVPYSMTANDLWNEVEDNFKYMTYANTEERKEIFDSLHPVIKRYFGGHWYKYLEVYNMTEEQLGYEKSLFLRTVPPMIDQQILAEANGQSAAFGELTAGTLKALSEGKKK